MTQLPPGVAIHRAGEYSLARLAELHAAGFAGYATPVHMDASALADRIRTEHIDLSSSFVMRHGDEDAVLVLVARRGNRSRIASMGVPTHLRRQGWGRQAMQVAIDEARQRGDGLQLEVLTDNHGAVALYKSMGFQVHRTLLGFQGTLTPGSAPGAESLHETGLADVAARVARYAPDLTWQLEAASLYGLGAGWRAWTNGPTSAVAKRRDDSLTLLALLTDPDQRRRGHARALLNQVTAAEDVRDVRIISIVPQGLADDFFHRCGLAAAPLRQFEMHLEDAPGRRPPGVSPGGEGT